MTCCSPHDGMIGSVDAGPTILLLTGPSGSGKTRLCERIATQCREQKLDLAGVLTPPRFSGNAKIGMDVVNLRTCEQRSLGGRSPLGSGPATETWHFDAGGLAWGSEILQNALPCDVLVIDELGPLELVRGEGWTVGIDLLRSGNYRRAVIVVRPELLDTLTSRLQGMRTACLSVSRENADDAFAQVVKWIGMRCD